MGGSSSSGPAPLPPYTPSTPAEGIGFQPPPALTPAAGQTVGTPTGPNVFDQSAGAYNQALDQTQNWTDTAQNFNNPWQQQVLDRSIDQMGRTNELALDRIGDSAINSGAFGGSRHGVVEGIQNSEFVQNAADLSARMNQQGWDNSMGYAGQQNAALSNLANQGFNFGNTLNQNQWGMGQAAQNEQQRIMDSAAGIGSGLANPWGNLSNALGALGGNPLMGQGTNTGVSQYNPSTGEKIGKGASAIGGFL